jgi:23S rRNA (uracil1939-C5)-methyltransferase
VKTGSKTRLTLTGLDDDGAGVGWLGPDAASIPDVELHVPGALPGEDISCRVDHVSAQRPIAWGTLETIHCASKDRVAPACRAYGRCGGCAMQHYDIRAQLAWKESALTRRIAEVPVLRDASMAPAVPSAFSLGYRNSSKLVAARDAAGNLVLGAYAPRTHDVVELTGCAVIEPALETVAQGLRDVLRSEAVQPYDEHLATGTLRYAVLRANAHGQVLVTLVTATDEFRQGRPIASILRERHPCVTGVVHNVNATRGNAIYGERERTLAGEATIEDEIGGIRLRISSRAFFQTNRHVAQAAYQAIAAETVPRAVDRVVDAYAGVGGIALTLARHAAFVTGIEEHAAAVEDAEAAAALNGITNTRFVAGDAARQLRLLSEDGGGADIVILNPPRKGCAHGVLECTAALHPRAIAYLSCSPATLVRDLTALFELGYRTTKIVPFDMLPHTPHLEVLAILAT